VPQKTAAAPGGTPPAHCPPHAEPAEVEEVKISATKELGFGHKKKGIISKKLGQMEGIYSEIHH